VTVSDSILSIVRRRPGLTERELAEEIFGNRSGYQQRANGSCRLLVAEGLLTRKGRGGMADPFRYELGRKGRRRN
jgi:hypothetical protein